MNPNLQKASLAAEESLSLLEIVDHYLHRNEQDQARQLLGKVVELGKGGADHELLNAAALTDVERDYNIRSESGVQLFPENPKTFDSAHGAMSMIWQLCAMAHRREGVPLPTSICGWLRINASELQHKLRYEREMLVEPYWVEQQYVADQFAASSTQIGLWCDEFKWVTNGKNGRAKLIAEDSVIAFARKKGYSYTIKGT